MIKKIKGLTIITDCSMPTTEEERIERGKVVAYNTAIEDVVKLLLSDSSLHLKDKERLCFIDWLKSEGYYEKKGSWFNKYGYERDYRFLMKVYDECNINL